MIEIRMPSRAAKQGVPTIIDDDDDSSIDHSSDD